jgi:hypothetical protein
MSMNVYRVKVHVALMLSVIIPSDHSRVAALMVTVVTVSSALILTSALKDLTHVMPTRCATTSQARTTARASVASFSAVTL